MSTENKIQSINDYVESFLFRHGFTQFGKVSLNCKFWLTNVKLDDYSNYFEVSSEKEAKEIVRVFLTSSFNENIFKDYIFDEDKSLYLALDIKLPL